MALPDRAANIMAALIGHNLVTEPIVFVCHSLGGLVVKQLLRHAGDRPGQPEGLLLQAVRGVVFIATPGAGSKVAGWVGKLRALLNPTPAIRDLEPNDAYVRELGAWYRNHAPVEDIATLNFVESQRFAAVSVVDASSGDQGIPGAEVIPIDADHFGTAKPQSRKDVVYLRTRAFLDKVLPKPTMTPVPMALPEGPQKVFISYRHTTADSRLAQLLAQRFRDRGHEVFIDLNLKVGMDWAQEIGRRIAWCDTMVVLLSEEAAQSEMVQQEVQMAHGRRKADGRPNILPVRVAFTGPLDYRLGAILDRIQYVLWKTEADDDHIVQTLLEAASQGHAGLPIDISVELTGEAEIPAAPAAAASVRPHSAADPRVLRRPDAMGAQLDDPCYIERSADRELMELADESHGVTTVKAPRQMGKTSLVLRYLAECLKHGKLTGYIDFNQFDDRDMNDVPDFLTALARQLIRECRLDPQLEKRIASTEAMTLFMEDTIFKQCPNPIALCFDEVDRLVGRPSQNDAFAILRSWGTRAKSHPQFGWNRLGLVLAVASEPSAFIADNFESPFNLSEPIRLQSFSRKEVGELAVKFCAALSAAELDAVQQLTGGQPFLVRLCFWKLFGRGGGMKLEDLDRTAADDDGPFSEHLRAKLCGLQRHDELAPGLGILLARGVQPSPKIAHRLTALGLIKPDGANYRIGNTLYERYFGRVLR